MSFVREKLYTGKPHSLTTCALCRLNKKIGGKVQGGPFKGMKLLANSIESAHYPKYLGTYEIELREWMEQQCEISYDTILNVGAGEGYYAVGLARRIPNARIIAYEMEEVGQKLLKELATLNQVNEQVVLKGRCTLDILAKDMPQNGKTLVIMDCEGEEERLLDKETIPELARATIVSEVHGDIIESGVWG